MATDPSSIEQAVSRTLRDNLERIQRSSEELHQAINDLVSACASSRPTNALPPMIRAQSSASSLAATLDVLSRFVTGALQPAVRSPFEQEISRAASLISAELASTVAHPEPEPAQTSVTEHLEPEPAQTSVTEHFEPEPAQTSVTEHLEPEPAQTSVTEHFEPEPAHTSVAGHFEPEPAQTSVSEHFEPEPAQTSVAEHLEPEPTHQIEQGSWPVDEIPSTAEMPPPAAEVPPAEPVLLIESVPVFVHQPVSQVDPVIDDPNVIHSEPVQAEPVFRLDTLPMEEQELHKRASRVAKVSMQDIKMLRPSDVQAGRENKDLCFRLRDDIEKAHKEYDRRFRSINSHPVDYFYDWMVEILAGGDPRALGEYPYPSPVLHR